MGGDWGNAPNPHSFQQLLVGRNRNAIPQGNGIPNMIFLGVYANE
jgi:hypothetical protein